MNGNRALVTIREAAILLIFNSVINSRIMADVIKKECRFLEMFENRTTKRVIVS